ncbi:probable flavoprotein [Lachnospiraceae bacterium KM106-2]|nr:probable flavoprotein [Lachnospiraceae bacterium KM106-2]
MKDLKLKEGLYWTGIIDDELRVFDIIMYTEFGTTYNSYVMQAKDKVILFETAKAGFVDEYIDKLKELVDVTKIDYLIVDHTEPDHAGSVEKLLELSPRMQIIATGCAIGFLKNIVNRDFYSHAVKDNEKMTIGDKTFHFMIVPNLHWPDTMFTYIEEDKVLATCDSFGSHYAFQDVLASKVTNLDDYWKATKYYFDCIIGPYKPYMLKALDRIEDLPIDMICTGHGPVLDCRIEEMKKTYREWCTVINPNKKKTVVMPYVSAYGYTKQIGEKIAEGIQAAGDIDVKLYDMVDYDQGEVLEQIGFADGLLFGTPTIVGEALKPIWDLTTSIFAETHGGKLASAFGSYGWSGEGVPHIIERLKQLRMNVVDGLQIKFKPNESDFIDAYDYGFHFGNELIKPINKGKKQSKGKSHLVKCIVCGEIFDSSLDICPVCGVGREYFVDVPDLSTDFRNNTSNSYVILGNGAAGISAARAIRERDATGNILMITNEAYLAYNRPMLTKSLISEINLEQLVIHEESWYVENKIEQLLSSEVVGINTTEKMIILSDKSTITYTKLIYALGAHSFIPEFKGGNLPEIVAIRGIDDVKKIASIISNTKKAVVIGGGVLGLEAAWELKKSNLEVTVLEMQNRLMPRQLDEEASELIQTICQEHQIKIRTGVKIAGIVGESHVTGVSLEDGETIEGGLVIISCGIQPNLTLAKAAGIQVGKRGIEVDDQMRTNIEDIYACGDCAEYKGINFGLWSEALEQGRVAGANVAGEQITYEQVSAALTFHGMETALYANGDNGQKPDVNYKTIERKDKSKRQYEKYYFANNQLCGVILVGDVSRMAKISELLERKATYQEVIS